MSFSSEVKEELSNHVSSPRHCQIAEMAAIIHNCGKISVDKVGKNELVIQTENLFVARKCFTLLRKTFNINTDIIEKVGSKQLKGKAYSIRLKDETEIEKVLQAIKVMRPDGTLCDDLECVNAVVIKNSCCKRAFLRGTYLAIGSMSDPEKSYHLEFVCTSERQALQLTGIIADFDIEARVVMRKKYHVVYMKEGAAVVDLLNIMEAHVSLMNMENFRILKEMRNSINRKVNCEAANITKTVTAASRQVQNIELIQKKYGFKNLPDNLREVAELRLDNPDVSLKELGELLSPPVGKSGVNHRLRKLSELADKLRA